MKILLIAVNAKYIHSNLAVYNLQKVTENLLREKGVTNQLIEVEICEYTINNRCEEVIHDIYSKHADLLAFSVYIWNVEFICQVANTLRCIQPEVPIWAGGPEVSYRPTEFLELYPAFTTILCGEGERIFSESIYEFYNGGKIPQIVYEDKIINMDCLPFVYPDLDTFNHRIIYYESSRGCPFSCSYCLSSIDKRTRYRNIELVKNELQYFIDKKVPLVKFIDRTFNSSHKHAMNIWEYILENDNNTTSFHFEIAADLLTDEEIEILSRMRVGLVQLEVGVQTFCEATLQSIRRTTNMERLVNNVLQVRQSRNIHLHLDLIAGLPYEDLKTFSESFNKIYALKPDELQLGFLKVLYGSEMASNVELYEIEKTPYPPYEVLSTKWLSFDHILELKMVEEALEIFYNSRQFECTILYLQQFFETPYEMFRALGEQYQIHFQVGENHSRMKRYEFLLACSKQLSNEIKEEEIIEMLTFDLYARENCKSRPEFAERIKDVTQVYLRQAYEREEERKKIRKFVHVESFSYNMIAFLKTGVLTEEIQRIRFDYTRKNHLTNNARVDIWREELQQKSVSE